MIISNFFPIHCQLDKLSQLKSYPDSYDLVITRAFAQFDDIVKYAIPFLKPGASLLMWKGQNWNLEYGKIDKSLKNRINITKEIRYKINEGNLGGCLLLIQFE